MTEVTLTEEDRTPVRDFLYRVVDVDGKMYSGYNNVLGLYRTEIGALAQIRREKRYVEQYNSHPHTIRSENFKDVPILRIERAEIVWERID